MCERTRIEVEPENVRPRIIFVAVDLETGSEERRLGEVGKVIVAIEHPRAAAHRGAPTGRPPRQRAPGPLDAE